MTPRIAHVMPAGGMRTCAECNAHLPAALGAGSVDVNGDELEWWCGACGLYPTRAHDLSSLIELRRETYEYEGVDGAWLTALDDKIERLRPRAYRQPPAHQCTRKCDDTTGWHEEVA